MRLWHSKGPQLFSPPRCWRYYPALPHFRRANSPATEADAPFNSLVKPADAGIVVLVSQNGKILFEKSIRHGGPRTLRGRGYKNQISHRIHHQAIHRSRDSETTGGRKAERQRQAISKILPGFSPRLRGDSPAFIESYVRHPQLHRPHELYGRRDERHQPGSAHQLIRT